MLIRVVGVIQAVWPPVPCGGVGPLQGTAEKMLLQMEDRVVKQDLIPNVRELEFANVPLKGCIIDPDVHGLLDGPSCVVHLLAHYGEIVQTDAMLKGVTIVIDGGREMFLHPFPKSPCRLTYVFLLAIHWSHLNLRLPYFSEWYTYTWEPQGRCFTGYKIEWETYTYIKILQNSSDTYITYRMFKI